MYDEKKYDPQAVDIWSLAIIYCCMTLRRFPWKLPRLSDNSFKLFAADPTPGHDPKKLLHPPSSSTTALQYTPERDFDARSLHNEANKAVNEAAKTERPSTTTPSSTGHDGTSSSQHPPSGEKKEVIRGPWRILRLLPRETRHIVGRMLELDPKKRATMGEILDDPWVADTVICRQEGGQVVNADDHTHVLEPPAAPANKP